MELGFLCTQHGTGKAWLTSRTGCARHSVRESPGSPNGMWRTRLLFGECGLSRTIIIFGDCAGGRLLSNLYPEKVLPRRLWAQDTLRRERTRRSRNPCWGARAPDGRRTFLRHVRTRRSRNPCWDESAPTLIGARTQTAGAGHFEARTDGATLRRTTRQVLLNQR